MTDLNALIAEYIFNETIEDQLEEPHIVVMHNGFRVHPFMPDYLEGVGLLEISEKRRGGGTGG